MKTFKKLIAIVLILVIVTFTSGYSASISSIDNLAYVIAIGLDVSENNKIKLSVQIGLPSKNTNSSESSSDSSSESASTINTVECSSIESGINLINSYISKKINLSHCKIIVISEELAKQGISQYINDLYNDNEIRPNCNIAISRCESTNFLKNSKPELEKLISKYYEIIPKSSQYTGYTSNITIGNFYSNLRNNTSESYAVLCNVKTSETKSSDFSSNITSESSNKPGDTLSQSSSKIETIGLAIFKNDALVGELNAIQTISHLILTNNFNEFNISISNPFNPTNNLTVAISKLHNTKNKVYLVNNTPYIKTDISLKAHLKSASKDNLSQDDMKIIEEYINSYLTSYIYQYLYLTSKDFKTDTVGFGKNIIKHYQTNSEWNNYDWLTNYQNSFFKVNISTTLQDTYTISK